MTASLPKPIKVAVMFGEDRLKNFQKAVGRIASWTVEHALFVGGLASIAFGFSMIYKPLGAILGGWFAVKVALLISADRGR